MVELKSCLCNNSGEAEYVEIHQQFLTKNNCYKANEHITPRGIMVHSTGVNNPALRRYLPGDELIGYNKYNNHWDQPKPDGREVCIHGFIGKDLRGDVQIYQTLPWNMRGWHCGGTANDTHIGFEICEDGLDDADYFQAVYSAAVQLCAYLCGEYAIPPGSVICHSEGAERGMASNHADVMHWFPLHGATMEDFRAAVAAKLAESEDEEMVRYERVTDIPNDYGLRDIVNTLMDAGIIYGDGSDPGGNNDKIDLSHDQVRSLVFNYRGGAFDRKLMSVGLPPAVDI